MPTNSTRLHSRCGQLGPQRPFDFAQLIPNYVSHENMTADRPGIELTNWQLFLGKHCKTDA
jgi:hypothetical protein